MFGKSWAVLRGVRGPHAHAVYVFEREVTSFGRGANSDIQILDQRVSRAHAKLTLLEDGALLEDLGSHNGTFVHGHQVHRRELRPGDRIRIGVAEYVFDRVKQQLLTSAVFLNKLTTKETVGATIVRRVAREILRAPTADMPTLEAQREEITRTKRPTRELFAQFRQPEPQIRRTEPIALPNVEDAPQPRAPEPAYVFEGHRREIELPAPEPAPAPRPVPLKREAEPQRVSRGTPATPYAPGYESSFDARPLQDDPPGLPQIDAPEIGAMLRSEDVDDEMEAEFETVPLDPRTQRVHTPVPVGSADIVGPPHSSVSTERPPSRPHNAPRRPRVGKHGAATAPDRVALEAALRTVDAVMRLLRLRDKEGDGSLLKIHDRERLRRLEQALREQNRGSGNRRRWARLPCDLEAELDPEHVPAVVTDIGAGGLRMRCPSLEVRPSQDLSIRVRLGEGRLARIAVFQTRVAWIDPEMHTFGASFAGPARWELAD